MKKYIAILFLLISIKLFAQQDAMYTQYVFNPLSFNPAFAGSEGNLSATLLSRIQWLSFDGSPNSQALTVHMPIFTVNNGIGLSLHNDSWGPMSIAGGNLNYSYKVTFTKNSGLALGLNAGLNVLNADLDNIETIQEGDIAFSEDIQSRFLPNFGFGSYYYNQVAFLGFSIPRFLKNEYYANASTNIVADSRESLVFYFIGAADFTINNKIDFRPSMLIKFTNAAAPEVDFTALLYFKAKLWAGSMLRTGDALGVLGGYKITDQLSIGYSYDWSYAISRTGYIGHSHEFMIRYNFVYKQKTAISSPRHFIF